MHESIQGATFHLEPIIPRSKGGPTRFENLAMACPGGNLQKADKTMAIDPFTGNTVKIFHPLLQRGTDHFRFNAYQVEGLTDTGRASLTILDLNRFRRQRIREVEKVFGLFPPTQ